jgi:phosphonate transport system permease protein
VHSVGSLGKLYSEAIESIEPGPVEAITATGADRVQTVLFGVIPQVVPTFLAVTIFWWDHNVRMSTVLGLVGGGGIGYLLIQYINLLQFNQAATVLWMIIVVVAVMDYASAAIRSRLV